MRTMRITLSVLFLISMMVYCAKTGVYSGQTAYMTIDRHITGININGKPQNVNPSQGDPNNWTQMKAYSLNFEEGDEIEIFGNNDGPAPAALIAHFTYVKDGVSKTFWTDENWTCGGKYPPVVFGRNGVAPWGVLNGIDYRAKWISNTDARVADTTSCKFVVPNTTSSSSNIVTATMTIDRTITGIKINGQLQYTNPTQGDPHNWTQMKKYTLNFDEGDEIELFGYNDGPAPAAMIASFTYTKDGVTKTFYTDENWSCGGKYPPVVFGAMGVAPWGVVAGIDARAKWISNTDARVADETSCKLVIPTPPPPTPKPTPTPTSNYSAQTAYITIDNVVTGIKINGQIQNVKPSQGDPNNWTQMKKYALNFQEGDEIEILGLNQGGPAGIIGSFTYNKDGVANTFWTDENWTCGGKHPPYIIGNNGVAPWNTIGGIDGRAKWIWNSNAQVNGDQTSCKIVIPRTTSSNMFITIDNVVTGINVNGKPQNVKPSQGDPGNWTQMKKYNIEFNEGDEIEIVGLNQGGPAGILGSFTFVKNGVTNTFWTDENWTCGGVHPPYVIGNNGVAPWNTIAGIDTRAKWIWNSNAQVNGDTTSCKIIVPKFGGDSSAFITIDNVVTGIAINGVRQAAYPVNNADPGNWGQMKKYALDFKEGDEIEIFGLNQGGPAGIIGSFTYTKNGVAKTFVTDENWECGGVHPPVSFGAMGVAPWNVVAGIDTKAKWIWNSTKQVNGDQTSCKYRIPKAGRMKCRRKRQ